MKTSLIICPIKNIPVLSTVDFGQKQCGILSPLIYIIAPNRAAIPTFFTRLINQDVLVNPAL
ncbi:hypothetical protein NIES4073_62840 [Kalymmatonema gypsitolerans NIES-4073]|nr:hypothetical protein NIES4073_62840 [Scytonema sp. NIES-4073]